MGRGDGGFVRAVVRLIQFPHEIAHDPVADGLGLGEQRNGSLEVIAQGARGDENVGVVGRQIVLRHEALAPRVGQFGDGLPHPVDPLRRDVQGHQVRLREVAVIVRLLLAAHGQGDAARGVEQPRFLHHAAAAVQHAVLALRLVGDGLLDVAERVQVLDLGARAKAVRAQRTQGDVGVAAQAAFLHVAVAHVEIFQDGLELLQVGPGLFGRAQVGGADDFHQRHAGAVQVDVAFAGVGKVFAMNGLAGVFFEVDTVEAYLPVRAVNLDVQAAALDERLLKLRNLIPLRQVGVEIILARKPVRGGDHAAHGEAGAHGQLDRLTVEHGQHAGQTEANRAGLVVRVGLKRGGARAEQLAGGQQLGVHFQADDAFIVHDGLPRGRAAGRPASGYENR